MPGAKPTKHPKRPQVPKEQLGLFAPRKRCSTCGVEKPATREFFRVRGDKIMPQCKVCRASWKRGWERETGYTAAWITKNGRPKRSPEPSRREKYQQVNAAFIDAARERRIESRRERERVKDRERRLAMTDEQRERERIAKRRSEQRPERKAYQVAKHKRRRQDPAVRLAHNTSRAVGAGLCGHGGNKGGGRTWAHLPYTPAKMRAHLESLWLPGMSWKNYGRPDDSGRCWHVDHIIPCASLPHDSLTHPNFARLWALDNLRPLWAEENMGKGSLWRGERWAYRPGPVALARGWRTAQTARATTTPDDRRPICTHPA